MLEWNFKTSYRPLNKRLRTQCIEWFSQIQQMIKCRPFMKDLTLVVDHELQSMRCLPQIGKCFFLSYSSHKTFKKVKEMFLHVITRIFFKNPSKQPCPYITKGVGGGKNVFCSNILNKSCQFIKLSTSSTNHICIPVRKYIASNPLLAG